jgi:integrase
VIVTRSPLRVKLAKALKQSAGVAARAVEFLMLTAARSGEARFATLEEFDFAARTWTVQAEQIKSEKE